MEQKPNEHLIAAAFDAKLLKTKARLMRAIADILDPIPANRAAESVPAYNKRLRKGPPPENTNTSTPTPAR